MSTSLPLRRICTRVAAVSVLLALASTARPDGCMIRPVGQADRIVASPKQEAVLATNGERVKVILRTHFRKGPEELAWVVPVPAKPDSVEEADDEIFARLARETTPRFYQRTGKGGGFGCGCGTFGNVARDAVQAESVLVESSGTAGVFEYVVLSATEPGALEAWLDENGYAIPDGAEEVFRRYVEGGWYWLAMRIRPEEADKPTLAPHPVAYTYEADGLVYPLVISQLSADEENEIVLYVAADQRYACANWTNYAIEQDQLEPRADTPSGTNYEELIREATSEHDGHLFVTEYAYYSATIADLGNPFDEGPDSEGLPHTTRLRAVMTPEAMDRDVRLVPVTGWPTIHGEFHVPESDPQAKAASAGAWLALIAAAGFGLTGLGLVGRRGWARGVGVVCIAGAAVLGAMV